MKPYEQRNAIGKFLHNPNSKLGKVVNRLTGWYRDREVIVLGIEALKRAIESNEARAITSLIPGVPGKVAEQVREYLIKILPHILRQIPVFEKAIGKAVSAEKILTLAVEQFKKQPKEGRWEWYQMAADNSFIQMRNGKTAGVPVRELMQEGYEEKKASGELTA